MDLASYRRQVAAIVLAYAGSILVYPWVPRVYVTRTPMTFGRPFLAFLLPTAALLLSVLLKVLWRRDLVRTRAQSVDTTFDAIVFRVVLFIVVIHATVLAGLLSVAGTIPPAAHVLLRAVPICLGLAFVGIGNLLPRVRPNLVIGVRTSRALADPSIWNRTNRFAGYVAVVLGIVLIGIGIFIAPSKAVAPSVGAAGLAALATAFAYSKRARTS